MKPSSFLLAVCLALGTSPLYADQVLTTWAAFPYLSDANGASAGDPDTKFPVVMMTETQTLQVPNEVFTKYDVLGTKPGSFSRVGEIQGLNPAVKYHMAFSPRAYQGYVIDDQCSTSMGIPFNQTGPASENCTMFSGHWLYLAGTTTTAAVTNSALTVLVEDSTKFTAGSYAVIYNAPAGSFAKAEHVKIKTVTAGKLTLESRGYKSAATDHVKGSVVAQHDIGQGAGSPENWAYNVSTQSPKDSKGLSTTDLMVKHLKARADDAPASVRLDGIYFDADVYMLDTPEADVNNDLVEDQGWSPAGINWWGLGMDTLAEDLRAKFPTQVLLSGSRRGRGFGHLNGVQMEGWPVSGDFEGVEPTYTENDGFESVFQRYNVHMRRHGISPAYVENLSKTPTAAHPRNGQTGSTGNAPFRFGFASTLLDDGYYGQQNQDDDPDTWYDEYAVDTVAGSPNYGKALSTTDTTHLISHKGWLGRPIGVHRRVIDPALFSTNKTLLANGGFETNVSTWTPKNVTVYQDTSNAAEGSASLAISAPIKFLSNRPSTALVGGGVTLTQGKTYTFAFAAKATTMRDLSVRFGDAKVNFLIPDKWTRVVFTVTTTKTGVYQPTFILGPEASPTWFDAMYLFEGNANLLWREFEHGAVLVNASDKPQTRVVGPGWQRIKGTGQDAINNGAVVTSVTVPAWDAAILVKSPPLANPQSISFVP